jgi:uncharacterized protein (TIGR02611 family)
VGGERQARALAVRDHLTRLREKIHGNPILNTTWQIGVFTVGVTVIAAGVVMLMLPGPGWLAIFLGFAILATEFAWAQAALRKARQAARRAKDRTLDPAVRRRNTIAAVILGVLTGAAITVYLKVFGFGLPWTP